ncbi:MAG: hypothetical protein QF473_03990, partial [Planctomycetota bacterium]|nr:hypothetical protein [Planctomycetota bacterium]
MPDPTKAQLKEQIAELKEQLAAQAEDPAKAVTPTPEAVTPTPAHHSPFTIHDLTVPLDVYLQPEGAAPSRRNWTLSLNPGRRHKLYSLAMALQAQKVGVRKHRHQDKVMVEKVDQAILWLIDAVQIRP